MLCAVGQGATCPPRLVLLTYRGNNESEGDSICHNNNHTMTSNNIHIIHKNNNTNYDNKHEFQENQMKSKNKNNETISQLETLLRERNDMLYCL
jgi:ABC-type oligopeptide transport system ATPase subunit